MELETKRFTKNDNGFVCTNCGKTVLPLGKSSRDHCPFCLYSIHVDINPGDRLNTCHGNLVPISCVPDPQKGYIIVYRCDKCGGIHRNRAAYGVDVQPDDLKLLIKLTAGEYNR